MKDVIPYKGKAPAEAVKVRSAVWMGLKFGIIVFLLCAVCFLCYMIAQFMSGESTAVVETVEAKLPVIVIDAGHGGMDSGALGVDGSLEKEINLAVAERIAALCRLSGIDCVMTRTEDVMLVPDDVKTHRKMNDLKNRLAVADNILELGREVIFISVHMNKFTSEKYSGLQVWYSPNSEESSQLASYVQGYAGTWLDKGNTREIKRATSAIYILDRAKVPAILVECGFLSNRAECAKLATDEYRMQVALTVFSALCDYMSTEDY